MYDKPDPAIRSIPSVSKVRFGTLRTTSRCIPFITIDRKMRPKNKMRTTSSPGVSGFSPRYGLMMYGAVRTIPKTKGSKAREVH
jgi:hypothetical protein